MRVKLKTDIVGYNKDNYEERRVHATKGDDLKVLINNGHNFICDSVTYPGEQIVLFPSQVDEIMLQPKTLDELEFEENLEYGTFSEQAN
jgi:hypothetical protein